jgi:uncharacterized phage protein (TIGR02220 family)
VGIKRIVDTSFWTDGKVDDFSPEDKYFMLYLLTNPFSTQLGIYEISIKQVAFQLGYSMDAVKVLIDRFENKYGMIIYSPETNEIAIKNFLRHSIIKGGAPVRDCLIKEIKKVKNGDLIARVFFHIKDNDSLNETVKQIIAEYEEKNGNLSYSNIKDNKNDNKNENDNEVSLPYRERIVNESQFEQIKSDILDAKGDGRKTCQWCGCKTTILHKHHFPIPKRLGGKEVVYICSNCHSEFHSKEREMMGGSFVELDEPNESPTNPCSEIISYLNEKAGRNFKTTIAKTKSAIKARMKEGFTVDDFKTVIDKKCAEWIGDPKMEKYLRPETLFGTKFEGYLNAKTTGRGNTNGQASGHHEEVRKIGNYI